MSKDSRCWVALVVGFSEIHSQVLASFLSFNALNRFQALQQIEKALPDNPKWLGATGELLPFRVYTLHQCAPSEVNGYASEYLGSFAEMFPEAKPDGAHSA